MLLEGIPPKRHTTYIKKYGRRCLESRWCVKESPKMLLIDTHCGCEKGRNYHRKFALKGVTGVFAVLQWGSTTECTVAGRRKYSVDLAQGELED